MTHPSYICPCCGGASGLAVYNSTCFDCEYPIGSQKRVDLVNNAKAMFSVGYFSDGKLPGDKVSNARLDDGLLSDEFHPDFDRSQR